MLPKGLLWRATTLVLPLFALAAEDPLLAYADDIDQQVWDAPKERKFSLDTDKSVVQYRLGVSCVLFELLHPYVNEIKKAFCANVFVSCRVEVQRR